MMLLQLLRMIGWLILLPPGRMFDGWGLLESLFGQRKYFFIIIFFFFVLLTLCDTDEQLPNGDFFRQLNCQKMYFK